MTKTVRTEQPYRVCRALQAWGAVVVAGALVPACGGHVLDLGHDPTPPPPQDPATAPRYATRGELLSEADPGSGIPTVIATHQNGTKYLALDDKRIYWTTYGPAPDPRLKTGQHTLRGCAKDDCAGTVVAYATQVNAIGPIATNGTNLYYAHTDGDGPCGGGCLRICPVEGCPAEPTQMRNVRVTTLAADTAHVYWLSDDATLQRCPAAGCGGRLPELVALTEGTNPFTLAPMFVLDEMSIVWSQFLPAGIVELEKGGANSIRNIAQETWDIQALAADSSRIYWTVWAGFGKPSPVKSCPRAGCGKDHGIFADQGGFPTLLAARDDRVYWFWAASEWFHGETPSEPAELFECPSTGCASSPRRVVPAQISPCAIAVDDTHIYWRTCFSLEDPDAGPFYAWKHGDGTILRVKR